MSSQGTQASAAGAFRAGHADGEAWEDVMESCLARLGGLDARESLGFVYFTDALAGGARDIFSRLRERTGIAHWVGSIGVGICAPGTEYFDRPAMAVLTGSFPDGSFRVFDAIVNDLEAFERRHGQWCRDQQARVGVVHGDPRNAGLVGLVAGLATRMGEGFLVGGLASSRSEHVQIADGPTRGGLSGVLFGGDVTIVTRLTQGCSPIGPRHAITRCQGNVVAEIDGRPALEVLLDELGRPAETEFSQALRELHVGLPVGGSDTGDYLVRNVIGIDPGHELLAIGERVERGDPIVFCRRDADAACTDMARMLRELKRALPGPPRAGLYHSCLARGPHLFGPGSRELEMIERELGSFPLAGFFGNGEISHDRVYGYTGVLTLFC